MFQVSTFDNPFLFLIDRKMVRFPHGRRRSVIAPCGPCHLVVNCKLRPNILGKKKVR